MDSLPARRAPAPGAPPAKAPAARAGESDRFWHPAEGWLSLVALAAMLLIVAHAVDDAHWAGWRLGGQSQTWFLVPLVLLAGTCGFIFARANWPAALAHLLGAFVGAGAVIIFVASVVSYAPNLVARLVDLDRSLAIFLGDVLGRQVRSDQTSAFLLLSGVFAWASAYFAAYAVFRHRRPLSAIVVLGLFLVFSMSLTLRDQFWYLVAFSATSLVLLVRMSLSHQRVLAVPGRLGDATAAAGLYLRNGLVFSAIALVGSLLLTSNASSAPLYGLWQDVNGRIVEWGVQLDRYLGGISGPARGPGGLFGSSQTIRGVWEGSSVVVFTATSDSGEGVYWRAATYDEFDGRTWKQTDRAAGPNVAPGEPVMEGTVDAVEPGPGRRAVTFRITPDAWVGDALLAPEAPYSVSLPAQLITVGAGGPFATLRALAPVRGGQTFTLRALLRDEGPHGLTGNQLAAAGTVYPAWASRYVRILPGSVGPLAKQIADQVVAGLPADQRDPYHVAGALQDFLYRGGGFAYDTDVSDICPAGSANLVDCFLTKRRGYCEYFATALAMMLRSEQIPARYVVGYLPGRLDARGVFTVERSAAHAWVEVYFPGLGWLRFDPTPGNTENGQARTALAAGPPVVTPTPVPGASASPARGPLFVDDLEGSGAQLTPAALPGAGAGQASAEGSTAVGSGLLLGGIVLVVLALLLLLWWRRQRRFWFPTPEAAWAGIVRPASRLGFRARPSQTVYEYAETLETALPEVAPELHAVALARVEATYGRRQPSQVRLSALRAAYRRVRHHLLLLVLPGRRR
jgi:hypothetical protein